MKLFRFPKRDPKQMRGEPPLMRLIRYFIIILLFCGVAWGFWMNSEKQRAILQKSSAMRIDRTSSLSKQEQARLEVFQESFRRAYGFSLRICIEDRVFSQNALAPDERAGAVFLGVSPAARQVMLQLPALVEANLGNALILYLRHVHFLSYFATGTWPKGLETALNLITRRLDAVLTARTAPVTP